MLLKTILSNFSRLNLGPASSIQVANRLKLAASPSRLLITPQPLINPQLVSFSLQTPRLSLMEFFDEKKNWAEKSKIKHGRPWRVEELRLKSNTDLHKLWFVLHKERNMLLTMEDFYIRKQVPMPSHERIAKVDESMENLLTVVEERNLAFNLLETGESKQRVAYRRYNSFGFIERRVPKEYLVPWYLNKYWKIRYHYKRLPLWSKFFRTKYRAYLRRERRKLSRSVESRVRTVMKKFPDLAEDKEYVRKYFEKKLDYKPPKPYHEMMRKPQPHDLDIKFKAKREKRGPTYYDEEF